MEQDELWSLFPPYRFPFASLRGFLGGTAFTYLRRLGYEAYFIFTEEAASVDPGEGIDAPTGAHLRPADLDARGPLSRFRASGISVPGFMRSLRDLFPEDLTTDRTDERRRRRLEALLRFFDEEPVRRFDIYVDREDGQRNAIALTLVPTSWTFVLLRRDRPGGVARRVFLGVDGAEPDQDYESAWLHRLAPVSPPLELRLRDIFSLNHIRDAGLGLAGGEPPPPSDPRDDGGRLSSDRACDGRWRPGGEVLST